MSRRLQRAAIHLGGPALIALVVCLNHWSVTRVAAVEFACGDHVTPPGGVLLPGESLAANSKTANSKTANSKTANSKPANSKTANSKTANSKTANSKTTAITVQQGGSNKGLRVQDEVWVVNTRHLSTRSCPRPEAVVVHRCIDGQWCEASLEQLWEGTDAITTVFVHGNRIDPNWARRHGWMVYRQLACGARPDERIRFVIWSWPSDRVVGPIRDARIKAQRANSEGYLLGWFLGHFPSESRLSLIGYSYGARVISGGLHLAGGGTLDGRALPLPTQKRDVHASFMAAAMHRDGLSKHGLFGFAQRQIGEILLFFNTADPILRRYFWLEKSNRQDALGFAGFYSEPITPIVNQLNVANIVGKSHDIERYFSQKRVVTLLRENALWRNEVIQPAHVSVQPGSTQSAANVVDAGPDAK